MTNPPHSAGQGEPEGPTFPSGPSSPIGYPGGQVSGGGPVGVGPMGSPAGQIPSLSGGHRPVGPMGGQPGSAANSVGGDLPSAKVVNQVASGVATVFFGLILITLGYQGLANSYTGLIPVGGWVSFCILAAGIGVTVSGAAKVFIR